MQANGVTATGNASNRKYDGSKQQKKDDLQQNSRKSKEYNSSKDISNSKDARSTKGPSGCR
jgi:hypothetical protein